MPDRDDRYGLEVWQRIRHQLPLQDAPLLGDVVPVGSARARRRRRGLLRHRPGGVRGRAAVAAAGRGSSRGSRRRSADTSTDANSRVRLAAIGDHLERSERVLLDVVNAHDGKQIDVSDAQAWASDLIDANRLYREAAVRGGDTMVADVLDQLERNLQEIVHGPSSLTPAQLDQLRVRSTRPRSCSKSAFFTMNSASAKPRPRHPGKRHEHAETDCVWSGDRRSPRSAPDAPRPVK